MKIRELLKLRHVKIKIYKDGLNLSEKYDLILIN